MTKIPSPLPLISSFPLSVGIPATPKPPPLPPPSLPFLSLHSPVSLSKPSPLHFNPHRASSLSKNSPENLKIAPLLCTNRRKIPPSPLSLSTNSPENLKTPPLLSLYKLAGIHTFKDEHELQRGEEIAYI